MHAIPLRLNRKGNTSARIIRKLGEGAQGSVYHVKVNSQEYSLKIYSRNDENSVRSQRQARLIYQSLTPKSKALKRAWMVDFGTDEEANPVLLNKLFLHSPFETLFNRFIPPDDLKVRQKIAIGAFAGVLEAHKNGIVHADLAPSNVLVSKYGEVAIIDFDGSGLSKNGKTTKPIVTGHPHLPGWVTPPENLTGKVEQASDIWWLGSIIMKAITKFGPFFFLKYSDKNSIKEFDELMQGSVSSWPPKYSLLRKHSKFNPNYTENQIKLIRQFLNETISTGALGKIFANPLEPSQRPSCQDLFVNFRWRHIKN